MIQHNHESSKCIVFFHCRLLMCSHSSDITRTSWLPVSQKTMKIHNSTWLDPFWGESFGPRWFSSQRANDEVHCSTLRWRHNDHAGVSNLQPPGCLLNRLFRRKSKKTSKLRVTGLCAGNSPGTGEFSAQMASYAENVSIWWRHHACQAVILHIWATELFLSTTWDTSM